MGEQSRDDYFFSFSFNEGKPASAALRPAIQRVLARTMEECRFCGPLGRVGSLVKQGMLQTDPALRFGATTLHQRTGDIIELPRMLDASFPPESEDKTFEGEES